MRVRVGAFAGIVSVPLVCVMVSLIFLSVGGGLASDLVSALIDGMWFVVIALLLGAVAAIPAYFCWRAAADRSASRKSLAVKTGLISGGVVFAIIAALFGFGGLLTNGGEIAGALAWSVGLGAVSGALFALLSWLFTEG